MRNLSKASKLTTIVSLAAVTAAWSGPTPSESEWRPDAGAAGFGAAIATQGNRALRQIRAETLGQVRMMELPRPAEPLPVARAESAPGLPLGMVVAMQGDEALRQIRRGLALVTPDGMRTSLAPVAPQPQRLEVASAL